MPELEGSAAEGVQPLNERQREAVDYNGGPLVVLAGPGTGKTRVITHRIARIVHDGAPPESIVALTFTVKAAEEMRVRLRALIGGAAADRVNAHTFHGFGQRLLRRFPDLVGIPSEFMLIDAAQRLRIARRVAREHGVFEGALAEGLDALVREGLEHITAFHHLGKFPDECDVFATAWAARLTSAEPTPDGAPAEAQRTLQARFARFVNLYAQFAGECRRTGQLCYEDLILLAVKLLRERPEAAAICRADYRHFVVDEFQDVNAGQIELLRQLCPPEARPAPDLCAVGDDDQSIYLFRGADDRAIDKFARIWKGSETIALSENYRSEDCILKVAAAVISGARHRFAPDKIVKPCPATLARPAAAGAGVECVETPDDHSFGEVIASMILADRAEHPERPWKSYAVIGRAYTDLDRIASAFAVEDIPFRLSRAPSALEDRGVQDVLKWIETLVDPNAPWAAHWVLTRPPLGLPAEQVQAWILEYGAERSRHRAGEDGRSEPGPFCEWLAARCPEDPGVRRFLALLAELQGPAVRETADRAIFDIIRATGVAHADLPPPEERRRRATYLADLLRFARERTRLLDPPAGLREFWSYFQDLDGSEEPFRGEDDDRVEGARDEDEQPNAVSVLTAHKAKGLEFDTVFVPRVSPGHGYPSTGKGGALELPDGFEDRAGDTREAAERSLDEERRLFYVACTRAQRRLVLLARGTKSRSQSTHFFQELALDRPALVVRRTAADVLAEAERAGIRPSAADLPGSRPRAGRAGVLDRAKREARLDAARALDGVERNGAGAPQLDGAATVFRDAAATLGVAAHLGVGASLPEWARDCPEAARAAHVLLARLAGEPEGGRSITRPMTPPLKLSYTAVSSYERCPKCFYLQHVLGFPADETPDTTVGDIAHKALKAFFDRVRLAEAEGNPVPGVQDLLTLGNRTYFSHLAPGQEADPDRITQLREMLRLTLERLHRPADEITELELSVRFEYEHQGVAHGFTAKFDRLDSLGASGHRIIDYKTGRERDSQLNPKPDDLQLGIYALALRHYQGVPLTDRSCAAKGTAEYWHLPTGVAGRIDLADIDYEKVRKRIGKAIEGMLTGSFQRKPGCERLCSFIDPEGP